MTIESLCRREPVTLDAGRSLHDAAAPMREEQVGCLVVTTNAVDGPTVVGVLTDRDLALEVLGHGRDPGRVPVAELVSGRLVTVPWDASLSDAVAAMEQGGVRRLLVTDEAQALLGVVSLDDIVEAWAGDMAALARALRLAGDREAAAAADEPAGEDARYAVPDAGLLAAWRHETPTP